MNRSADVLVLGGGIFGVTAAAELRARGADVLLVDPGPLPHPDAASTDISKLVRLDYGADGFYLDRMEEALPGWRTWNERWPAPLFHETGIAVLTAHAMKEGTFEGDSWVALRGRGHPLERLDARTIAARFPMWREGRYVDGYVNPKGGWAESGRVVAALLVECERAGVRVRGGVVARPLAGDEPVRAITTTDGETIAAGTVVVAAGAWTPVILPELVDRITPIGQSVFHFAALEDERDLVPPRFLPWAADIGETGWYGFPAHEGVLKIANHGPGTRVDPSAPRAVPDGTEEAFRTFVRDAMARMATSPIVKTRLCLYSDSFDGDFFIDRHPTREGLVVASGGSGHAFKFAPLLGAMVADAVEKRPLDERRKRFRWRELGKRTKEAARR